MKNKPFLKSWETALLMALCVSLLSAAWAEKRSDSLSRGLIRLHVVAVSDDEEEQRVKLLVRDAVLDYLSPRLAAAEDAAGAALIIRRSAEGIRSAAAGAAGGRSVKVTLGREYYPTRDYQGFSLPAGEYSSLRVTLGGGEGRNWWCVVFPPLCVSAAEAGGAMETLSDEDAAIITEDGQGYVVKFRLLELWGELKAALS